MRQKLREGYARKWSGVPNFVKSIHKLPPGRFARVVNLNNYKYLGDGLLLSATSEENGLALNFLRIPPVASRKPLESWSTPPFSFVIMTYAVYLPEDVIAVAEQKVKCVTRPLTMLWHTS